MFIQMPNNSSKKSKKKLSKRLSKKGIVFTMISVVLSAVFIALLSSDFTEPDITLTSNTRITVLDSYVKSFEKYSADSLKISSYRTLISLYEHANETRTFFTDYNSFNTSFYNCMMCGFMERCDLLTEFDTTCPGMSEVTLTYLLDNISDVSSNELNIVTEYKINSLKIYQSYSDYSPFYVTVSLNISFQIYDLQKENYAWWDKNIVIRENIPITGLMDPLSAVNTNNYEKQISESNICYLDATCWNITNTQKFYESQSYRYFVNGTGYLERFWNGTGTYCTRCGLESFVNMTYASGNLSYLDIYYWSGEYNCSNSKLVKINGINESSKSLILDPASAIRYGVFYNGVLSCSP